MKSWRLKKKSPVVRLKKTENRGIDPIANREEGMALVERIKDLPFVVTSVAQKRRKGICSPSVRLDFSSSGMQ